MLGCIALFYVCFHLKSQISPLYERHTNYEQFINPAITGRDLYPFLNVSHKNYWLETEDSPYSICIGASARLGTFNFYNPQMMLNKTKLIARNRMGFGAFAMYESNGPLKFFTSKLTYAYFVPLSQNSISELSFGLSLELSQYVIDESMLDPLDANDPKLTGLSNSNLFPESDFGVYYHNKQFQVGFSINELFQTQLPYNDNRVSDNSRDVFFQTGYKFYLKRFELEPLVYAAKINDRPVYLYNQIKLYYLNYNWIALAYKTTNTITASIGLRVRRMTFGYAYECNVSRLQKYFGGSHEIMMGLNIGLFEPEGIRKTVKIK